MPAAAGRAATTIVVNTGTDHAASGGECSGAANDCALRQAIDKAASGDTIQIPSSVPTSNVTLGAIPIASKNLTITGAGSGSSTIDGHSASGIFNITGAPIVSISGVTVTRGNAATGGFVQSDGGQLSLSDIIATANASGGSNTAGFGVIDITATASTSLSIANSTFSSNTVGGGGASGSGFGVINVSTNSGALSIIVSGSTFADNTVGGGGGSGFGVFNISGSGSSSAVKLTNTTFSGNANGGANGSGYGVVVMTGSAGASLTVNGGSYTSNTLGGGSGSGYGIIDFTPNGPGSRMAVNGATFSHNTSAAAGGGSGYGIIDASIPANGSLVISGSTFSNNTLGGAGGAGGSSGSGFGGGLLANMADGSTLSITGSSFSGNHAGGDGGSGGSSGSGYGGGIYISPTGANIVATLSRVTVANNTAGGNGGVGNASGEGFGGGIVWSATQSSDQLTILNSTIAGNTAGGAPGGGTNAGTGFGGGLEIASGTVQLINDTIDGNTIGSGSPAANGAGLTASGATNPLTLKSTILANNLIGGSTVDNCGAAVPTAGYNIELGTTCGLTGTGDLNADPGLGALGDNGGPLQTQAPAAGGPAIDHVPAAACTDADGAVLTVDERGVLRPQGASCDAGAYERAPALATTGTSSGIGQTSATIAGAASNPDLLDGTVRFEYGPTTAYGSQTASQTLAGGATSASFSAGLTGLAAGTTYHYRLVAASPDGTSTGADGTFTTQSAPAPPAPVAPVLGPLTISPSRVLPFTGAGASIAAKRTRGAKVSYTDSEAATTTFTVRRAVLGYSSGRRCVAKRPAGVRKPRRCTRWVAVGTFTHVDAAGAVSFRFTGRVGRKPLRVGSYRLDARAKNAAGQNSKIRSARFRVVR